MNSDADVLRAFLQLFQWVFEVELPTSHARTIEHEIRVGWANNDPSERELVAYILEMYTRITKASAADRSKLRAEAKRLLARMFGHPEPNDRGRVLAALHRCFESLRPGVTGVLPPGTALPTATPNPHVASLVVPPYSPSGPAPNPSGPSAIPGLYPASASPPAPPYGQRSMAMVPSNPYVPSQGYVAAPMQGYPNAAPSFGWPGAQDPSIAKQQTYQQRMADIFEEEQRVTMESNIQAARHRTSMAIINNMK